jgi:hypothetical protein
MFRRPFPTLKRQIENLHERVRARPTSQKKKKNVRVPYAFVCASIRAISVSKRRKARRRVLLGVVSTSILLYTWYMGKRAPIYRAGKASALS